MNKINERVPIHNSKIDSLQALRGAAMLVIILSHIGFKPFTGFGEGGVSIFLILSGFLMMYNYFGKNRIHTVSLKCNCVFAYKKVGIHIYILHILTAIVSSVFWFVGSYCEDGLRMTAKSIMNILLLQEWLPISGRSINGVAWFLSAILFCYFLFPFLLRYFEKRMNKRRAILSVGILYILQIGMGLLGSFIVTPAYVENGWFDADFTLWFGYYFPPTRSIDFVIGCCLGYLFLTKNKEDFIEKYKNIFSVGAIAMGFIACVLCYIFEPKTTDTVAHPENWWTYSVIFTLSSCLLIYLCALGDTKIARFITNRITVYFGNISQYIFLIHFVVFRYIEAGMKLLLGEGLYMSYGPVLKLTVGVVVSLVLTEVWMRIIGKRVKF